MGNPGNTTRKSDFGLKLDFHSQLIESLDGLSYQTRVRILVALPSGILDFIVIWAFLVLGRHTLISAQFSKRSYVFGTQVKN
jgi:hypothetical protein